MGNEVLGLLAERVKTAKNRKRTRDAVLKTWPEHWLDMYEERAAIAEYDGMFNREDAEQSAYEQTLEWMKRYYHANR